MILREDHVRKRRAVPKDRKTKKPKKYLGSTRGAKRSELASVLKRIAKLAKSSSKCYVDKWRKF